MRSTFRAAFCAVAIAGLFSLSLNDCANGAPEVPPAADAGVVHDGSSEAEAAPACGGSNQLCCVPENTCHTGFFCNLGECKPQNPGDIGKPCVKPSDCQSGLCVVLGTDSGITPASPTVCSNGCDVTKDCMAGWTCTQQGVLVGQGVCTCTPQTEQCDGLDDNCDGKVDEEPAADEACTTMDGVPEKCVGAMCTCMTSCSGSCVDLTMDPNNCGKCGTACTPTVEACVNSMCSCAATMCGNTCIDTTMDPANCGGCNMPCPYQCTNSICGPTVLGTGMAGGLGIVSDGTTVFWFSGSAEFGTMSLVSCAAAGCMNAPTTVPGATMVLPSAGTLGGVTGNLLAIGGTEVLWPDSANVQQSPLMVPTATTFHLGNTSFSSPFQVATDATNAYWTDNAALVIFKCALGTTCTNPTVLVNLTGGPILPDGGIPEAGTEAGVPEAGGGDGGLFVVPTNPSPALITVDSKYVYWTDGDGNIDSMPLIGGPLVTIYNNEANLNINFGSVPNAIVAFNGIVYWTMQTFGFGNSVVNACAANAPCPLGTPGIFAQDTSAFGLATDGTSLYWTNSTPGAVRKCALGLTCATPTTLVTPPSSSPTWIAVDAMHTYWLDSTTGSVSEYSK